MRETFSVLEISKSLKTTLALAAKEHLAEQQCLIAGQTLKKEKSLRYRVGTRRPTVSRAEGQNFKTR
jgi:hypothetical protein